MDWMLLILLGIAIIALLIFLIIRNRKDQKTFERQLNNDYRKKKEEEKDIEIDDTTR